MRLTRPSFSRLPVLLVDSDERSRTEMSRTLRSEGYAVCEAESGEQAISLCARRPLCLTITELVFGGNEGFEIVAEMRRELVCARFIGTARKGWQPAFPDGCARERIGADLVLFKPFSSALLLSAVREVLGEIESAPIQTSLPRPSPGSGPPARSVAAAAGLRRTETTTDVQGNAFSRWREKLKGVCGT
ncbi:MAG TPA: response regulator [Candidatus Acidoferrum sp.]|nr:response regulator [Candidatus Acidoferrum sp.]